MSQPSRKVVTRSPKRTVGLINCRWFQPLAIEHESRLEKHFVLRAILYPGLHRVRHQPFRLSLGGRESYTPDFLLTFASGEPAVVEVKRAEKVKEQKERFNRIATLLAERNLHYFVVHQGQIEGQKIAQRACLLRRYATQSVPAALTEAVIRHLDSKPKGVSLGELRRRHAITQTQLYALVARRLVAINRQLLLADDDVVLPIKEESSHAALQFGSWFGCAPWKPNA